MNNSELDEKLLFEFENFEIEKEEVDLDIDISTLKKLSKKLLKYEISKSGIDNYDDYERILEEVLENDNF